MVQSVTISGSKDESIALRFDATSNFSLAQQIGAFLNTQIADGKLVTKFDSGGSIPAPPPGTKGVYVQTKSTLAILPPGYTTDLITKPGSAQVFGSGTANQVILSDLSTDLTFMATSGSGTVVAGGGNNRLLISGAATPSGRGSTGDGDDDGDDRHRGHHEHDRGHQPGGGQIQPATWTLFTGNGNDFISVLGNVSATVGAGGGNNTIVLGSGTDFVLSAGHDTIQAGTGAETIDATSAKSDFVAGGSSDLYFIGGAGGATILGGSGSDTYMGSTFGPVGKQLIQGGSGGNNYLFAGDGAATLIGGGKGDQLFAYGSSAQWLRAGAGNETLSAALSGGNDTLTAGSGKDLLIGGLGSDTFVGGSGAATVSAGIGNDVFAFIKGQGGGSELVTGIFDPSSIQIALEGYGAKEVDKALASQTVKHGSVTVSLTDGTKITFQDVTSLHKSNFI